MFSVLRSMLQITRKHARKTCTSSAVRDYENWHTIWHRKPHGPATTASCESAKSLPEPFAECSFGIVDARGKSLFGRTLMPGRGVELKTASSYSTIACVETETPGGPNSGPLPTNSADLVRLAKQLLDLPEADRRKLLKLLTDGQREA